MSREIVTVCVGNAGVSLGKYVWEQYCAEHCISLNGATLKSENKMDDNGDDNKMNDTTFKNFYEETDSHKYIPRCLMIDSDPDTMNEVIFESELSKLFNRRYCISGKCDAVKNFATGYYNIGSLMINTINDKIRQLLNKCDNIQGFIIKRSVGGGTGSGLGSLLLERLCVDYKKQSKIGLEIYPYSYDDSSIVTPYNSLLGTHYSLDNMDVSVIMDNERLKNLNARRLLHCGARINYDNHNNNLIKKNISSITSSFRFSVQDEIQNDLKGFVANLVPFPRLHFMITSTAPIAPQRNLQNISCDIQSITEQCFSSYNFFTQISDFDGEEDKYLAISVKYHGDVTAKEANKCLMRMEENRKHTKWQENTKVSFVDWCPTKGFNMKIHQKTAAAVKCDNIAHFERNVVMVGNNVAIGRLFRRRILEKFDLIYSQKAYVHCYTDEGMEEDELTEARENVGCLEKDYIYIYLDMVSENVDEIENQQDSDNNDY